MIIIKLKNLCKRAKLLLFIFILIVKINAANSQHVKFNIQVTSKRGLPEKIDKNDTILRLTFSDRSILNVFNNYKIYNFHQSYPTARSLFLQSFYSIECNDIDLMRELLNYDHRLYPYASIEEQPQLLYEPNDYINHGNFSQNQTALDLIRAKEAWDITKGDSNIVIGITDTKIETTHEDLKGQIIQVLGNNNSSNGHGVRVAGCAAAATDNGKGISAIGYNCKLLFSSVMSNNEILLLSQMGAKVLNASWLNSCSSTSDGQAIYNEIYENGTVVVAGAGNNQSHCGSLNAYVYPASYDHVISVTSVGHLSERGYVDPIYGPNNWKDVHEEVIGNPNTAHHHNDKIDICAPGYNVLTTNVNNEYAGDWGTSFAAPQIAGVCALIFSINPCLTPDDVEYILKSTAVNIDTIPQNMSYAGLLGAGRVDAEAAVQLAANYYVDFSGQPIVAKYYLEYGKENKRNRCDSVRSDTYHYINSKIC